LFSFSCCFVNVVFLYCVHVDAFVCDVQNLQYVFYWAETVFVFENVLCEFRLVVVLSERK
jgi:hypothetical protein